MVSNNHFDFQNWENDFFCGVGRNFQRYGVKTICSDC